MNIIGSNRRNSEVEHDDEHTEGASGGMLGRRGVLGGLATIPVLYSLGGAVGNVAAATAPAAPTASAARPGGASVASADSGLVRGQEQRYHAPMLKAGTRLVLPAGVKVVPVLDPDTRPRLASASTAWPALTAADGSKVDASVIPAAGAASRSAILSGFSEGWYEVRHADGRSDRVMWDAAKLPYLWLQGEFGASPFPFGVFYSLSLQPLSQNPFSRRTSSN